MHVRLFQSLRFRLITSVVAIEVIMLSILVWSNIDIITYTHQDRLYDTANSLVKQFAKTAGRHLIEVDYATLEEHAQDLLTHEEVHYLSILDTSQKVIMELGTSQANKSLQPSAVAGKTNASLFEVSSPVDFADQHLGFIHLGLSRELMFQTISKARNRSIFIASIEVLLSIIVTIFITMHLTRNLRLLSDASEKVGAGNYAVSLPVMMNDEIGLTAKAFNNMVSDIKLSTEKIRSSEMRLKLLMQSTAEAIYGVDTNGTCTFVNPSCVRLLGYTSETELLGKNMHTLIHHSKEDGRPYPQAGSPISKTIHQHLGSHSDDEILWRKDGSWFYAEYWSHPIYENNDCIGAVVTFFDISERKAAENELKKHRFHLEELVAERTNALEATNKELEAFSYSVSHDLRAPLRSIDGFSLALLEDYQDQIDDTGKDYLIRVRNGAQRMGNLIDDLLNLSRVSRGELQRQPVDMSELAISILKDLHDAEPNRKISWHIEPGLEANVDKNLIEAALVNLLNNAWKYSSKCETPEIEFNVKQIDRKKVFYVKDNGAGFNPEHAGKLFGAFQRLHSDEDFPGTGVGLATVQRIINRHGGRIWAEAEEGKGATFLFTLPDASSKSHRQDNTVSAKKSTGVNNNN